MRAGSIRGMVKVPVPTTLATAEPLMVPIRPEATTADRAAPARILPVRENARLLIKELQPDCSRKEPNMTNMKITVAETLMVVPKMPSRSVERNWKIRVAL